MFPRNEKPERGHVRMFLGTKTGTRARSPKPPFYETALLSPSEKMLWGDGNLKFFQPLGRLGRLAGNSKPDSQRPVRIY